MNLLLLYAMIVMWIYETASGARIIMASPQLGSHILEQVHLGEEMVSRGHEVYIAIGSRYPKRQDMEKRGIMTLQYKIPDDVLYSVSEDFERLLAEMIFQPQEEKLVVTRKMVSEIGYRDCALMMTDKAFRAQVKDLKFDIAVIDPFLFSPCLLILPKYFGIPFVSMSVFLPWTIRVPALPSFIPILETWTERSDITLYSKLKNVAFYLGSDIIISWIAPPNTTLLQRFAPDISNWNDLLRQSELFLFGCDHHFCSPIPEMPNYVSVAGLSTTEGKKLPDSLHDIVEQSVDGVILLSFGSSASNFPAHVITKFLDAFAILSQTVIVRFAIPEKVKVPGNVKVLSWLPQNDILAHPNTKLFITHCGIHGIHETLYHGVPVIGFPLFAEQNVNCLRARKIGFGLEMSIYNFTSSELYKNIQEILNNAKYKVTIQRASEIFRDQPIHPRKRGAFWVEHVIRHGGKHLRSLAMDMPLCQFIMLDIIGLFIVGTCVCLIVAKILLKYVWRVCFRILRGPQSKLKST